MKINKTYTSSKSNLLSLLKICRVCTGGELFDKIVEETHFSEKKAATVFKQILQAILYTHKNNICHR